MSVVCVCVCGSETFQVTYQTNARVSVTHGLPTAVTYGSAQTSRFFAVVSCDGCGLRLDVDDTVITADGTPATPALSHTARPALIAARNATDHWVDALPTVTVRSRHAPAPRTVVALPDSGVFARA